MFTDRFIADLLRTAPVKNSENRSIHHIHYRRINKNCKTFCCNILETQYTPPTPTRRDCRVESRRRCVLSCRQLATVSTSLNKFADNKVELCRGGGVNAPVGCRDPVYNSAAIAYGCRIVNWPTQLNSAEQILNMLTFQIFDQIRRRSSWASCEFNTHRATSQNFDATQLDSCVAFGVGGVYFKKSTFAVRENFKPGKTCSDGVGRHEWTKNIRDT